VRKVRRVSFSLAQTPAFEAVFERHFEEVCGFLCRRVGRDLGEELAAETFARAFASWSRYDVHRGAVRPWLFGIASNLLRDHRRTEARGLRALARAGRQIVPSAEEGQFERLVGRGEARRLAAALARLRAGDRDVLLLAAWADLNSREIAAALEIPAGTVRSRLNRARRQVRAALAPDCAAAARIALKELVDG
jgi:RNA polymerase sigma factor (sigma-70 family)